MEFTCLKCASENRNGKVEVRDWVFVNREKFKEFI